MFNKPAAFVQINASALQLTNSLVAIPAQASAGGDGAVAGTSTGAVPLAGLALATISADYAPGAGGGSTTYPELVVELSRDPLTTAPASDMNGICAASTSGITAMVSPVVEPPTMTSTLSWSIRRLTKVRAFSASPAVIGVLVCASAAAGPACADPAGHITTIVAAINAAAIDPTILPISSSKAPASRSHYPFCERLERRSSVT